MTALHPPGPATAPAIDAVGLAYSHPDGTPALRSATLRVEAGERLAVLGPNGAGKTTLALHLNGILRPAAGTVEVCGLPVDDDHLADVRRRVQLVFEHADDQLFMPTVHDDVAFGPANAGLAGADLEQRVEGALLAVGALDLAGRVPHHLSNGEKRRVALATALALEPDVLVLDEPTSGLDPAGRRQLLDLLAGRSETLLVITHDLAFALELCPRAAVVDEGRVVTTGPTRQVLGDDDLLAAHRLELPYGFDRALLAQATRSA